MEISPVASPQVPDLPKIREAASKFESLFVSMLLAQMREASGAHVFGEGPGAQVLEGIFDSQLGDSIGRSGGLGLADSIEKSLVRMGTP